jgi:hypothetical protein
VHNAEAETGRGKHGDVGEGILEADYTRHGICHLEVRPTYMCCLPLLGGGVFSCYLEADEDLARGT